MNPIEELEIFDCPICHGTGVIEEENGWCLYVECLDCYSHTAELPYHNEEERQQAAQQAYQQSQQQATAPAPQPAAQQPQPETERPFVVKGEQETERSQQAKPVLNFQVPRQPRQTVQGQDITIPDFLKRR